MDVTEFGLQLLETEDLDPVYCMVAGPGLDGELLCKWLLAYWMFYHSGVASRLTEAKDFWKEAQQAQDEKWPRGTERRYFRGKQSQTCIDFLSATGTPHEIVRYIARPDHEHRTFKEVSERAQTLPMFGPWIAFKIADMVERNMRLKVDFSDCELEMYEEPKAGANLVMEDWKPDLGGVEIPNTLSFVVRNLIDYFRVYKAPPFYDRQVNIQEVETILCKYKSYRNGHYYVGKDIHEVGHHLEGWGDLAQELTEQLPEPVAEGKD